MKNHILTKGKRRWLEMRRLRIKLDDDRLIVVDENETKYRSNEPDFIGENVEVWMTRVLDYIEVPALERE